MTPFSYSIMPVSLLLLLMLVVMTAGFLPTSFLFHRSAAISSGMLSMFTGIVEEMGTVVSLQERHDMTLWDGTTGTGTELVVQGDIVLKDAYLG
jgi:hypothetical protein